MPAGAPARGSTAGNKTAPGWEADSDERSREEQTANEARGTAGLVAVLADPGVDAVVGHGLCGQHPVRLGDRIADHPAVAVTGGADRGQGPPGFAAAPDRPGALRAVAVLASGGVVGDQAGTAAAERGAAGALGDQVGSGAGTRREYHHADAGVGRAGDRPGAPNDLRACHRRRIRSGRESVLPPGFADRAPPGGDA